LPTCRGPAEAAWVNGDNPGGVGISPSCRQRRGPLCCRPQEGGPHHHRGPAGDGKVLVTQPAGGSGHGHVSVECLLQQRRHQRHKKPGLQLDVRQCQPATNGKTNESNNSRGGPGQDEGDGHARDPQPAGVECVRGATRRKDQGRGKPGCCAPCLEITAVRRSRFGHLEPSSSDWDGDRPGKTFWQVFGVLTRGEAGQVSHTPIEHRVRRPLGGEESQVERSSRPSRSVWRGPYRMAATWRSSTPTKRIGQVGQLSECTALGGLREECKVQRPSRTIRCEPCLSAA
jgi:hypothetical protein